ncbi:MAG TPA: MerR family transcriptional regulator, partial [Candidatus Binatus sp.]|nr:MerR family transcriptional regulator [Candidatus Binatus sp.]
MYTIKAAAARSGVPVATLRAWERRYRVIRPARTASGYRLYDEDSIARIAAMRRRVESGWQPSVAAAEIVRRDATVAPRDAMTSSPGGVGGEDAASGPGEPDAGTT